MLVRSILGCMFGLIFGASAHVGWLVFRLPTVEMRPVVVEVVIVKVLSYYCVGGSWNLWWWWRWWLWWCRWRCSRTWLRLIDHQLTAAAETDHLQRQGLSQSYWFIHTHTLRTAIQSQPCLAYRQKETISHTQCDFLIMKWKYSSLLFIKGTHESVSACVPFLFLIHTHTPIAETFIKLSGAAVRKTHMIVTLIADTWIPNEPNLIAKVWLSFFQIDWITFYSTHWIRVPTIQQNQLNWFLFIDFFSQSPEFISCSSDPFNQRAFFRFRKKGKLCHLHPFPKWFS